MKPKQMLIAVIVILILLYFWNKTKTIAKTDTDTDTDTVVGSVMGCTNNIASNYNSLATEEDGSCVYPRQACCNILASDYDPTCESDTSCLCSSSECTLITGRTGCCDSSSQEFDPTCTGDPDCTCDQSLCLNAVVTQGMRTSCCSAGSTNYDSTCGSDPFCNCDNTICQIPQSAHLCHSICNDNGGYSSILTTLACGTGAVSNYPASQDPNCSGAGA
tara:strand:- start:895 stop:1548 length:654 start_codon:yes stop_codon:yes gene_type:complete